MYNGPTTTTLLFVTMPPGSPFQISDGRSIDPSSNTPGGESHLPTALFQAISPFSLIHSTANPSYPLTINSITYFKLPVLLLNHQVALLRGRANHIDLWALTVRSRGGKLPQSVLTVRNSHASN